MDMSIQSPEDLQRELGKAVRSLRVSQHLTQQDVAAKAGASHKSVAKLERGEGSTVETFVRILRALKATQLIGNLAPQSQISPLALLRSPEPRQRVRHRRGETPPS